MQLTVTISLGWSAVLAFFSGGLFVGIFWYREHRRYKKDLDQIERAVRRIVFDERRNALVENIVARVEMGNKEAMRDWQIIDHIVRATFTACQSSNGPWSAWLSYRGRVLNAQKVE